MTALARRPATDVRESARIEALVVTPIAFRDPPLLNTWGVHEPLALRSIVELHVGGRTGLGEGSGELVILERLELAAEAIRGMSVFDTGAIERRIRRITTEGSSPELDEARNRTAFSIIEVACLDAQGRLLGLPVTDLLGGRVRDTVPYSAYLFYKWGGHPGGPDDDWGPALDPEGVVAQARRLVDAYGFGALKLKGGVFPPAEEIRAVRALAEAFPGLPLRLDPNGAWTTEVAVEAAESLSGILDYLEDPVASTGAMSAVASTTALPLATNMCVVSFDTIPEAVARRAVGIVLSDHHTWGGLRHTRELAAICDTFGLGVSMHSNSHLGISLAAMTHVAATIPNLDYACDTHYPWNSRDDIVDGGPLVFSEGALAIPDGPGLGVELDRARFEEAHRRYRESGRTTRDDTGYMRAVHPDYDPRLPRFTSLDARSGVDFDSRKESLA